MNSKNDDDGNIAHTCQAEFSFCLNYTNKFGVVLVEKIWLMTIPRIGFGLRFSAKITSTEQVVRTHAGVSKVFLTCFYRARRAMAAI